MPQVDSGGATDALSALTDSAGLDRILLACAREYAVFALDADGYVRSWNESAQRIKGYLAAEIIGQHFSTFYLEADRIAGIPLRELEIAAREDRFIDDGRRVRNDGSRFWAHIVITTLRDQAGAVLGFAKVTRDLSELRRADETLRYSEERFRLLVEDVKEYGIFMLDPEGRVATWNAGAQLIKGYSAEEIIGRHFSTFYPTDDLAAAKPAWALEVALREGRFEEEGWRIRKLRTPLNAIGGYTDLIDLGIGGPVTDHQRDYLARSSGAQQRLLGIITDLLNYSKLEGGQMTYDIVELSAHAVVHSVIPLLERQALAKGVVFDLEMCPDPLLASGDRPKVEQIILNLLSNALKFTPVGGRVGVACGTAGHCTTISVRDTGPGIPPEKQLAIFEPFVQLGRSLTSPQEGTGLGLAISREFARAMGGDVTVESEIGAGSTFTLALPRIIVSR